jgi:hypothetical protein
VLSDKSYGIRSFNFKGGDLYTFVRDAATPLLENAGYEK